MMFKHYYPLIPIRRPLQLAFAATGCVAAGAAYYLYRSLSKSDEDLSSSEPEVEVVAEPEPSLDSSNELISISHSLSTSVLFGLFESYLIARPHLTSSRLSLLDDEAAGAKKRNYSSSTSECTTDLSGNKPEDSNPQVDLEESSFGDVVLVLKDDKERHYDQSPDTPDESSDTPDDTYNEVAKDWFSDLQSTTSEEEEHYEIEYVDFYDRY